MSDEDIRGIIHGITHDALPPAANTHKGVQERARVQVRIADEMLRRFKLAPRRTSSDTQRSAAV